MNNQEIQKYDDFSLAIPNPPTIKPVAEIKMRLQQINEMEANLSIEKIELQALLDKAIDLGIAVE